MKAVGICAVVYGHAGGVLAIINWIYSFHMPLFFFVAGVNMPRHKLSIPFSDLAKTRLRKLFIQYTIFTTICSAFYIIISQTS